MIPQGVMNCATGVIDSVIHLTIHCGSLIPDWITRTRRHSSSDEDRPILWPNSPSSAALTTTRHRGALRDVRPAAQGFRAPC
jgi:hypothetical protein